LIIFKKIIKRVGTIKIKLEIKTRIKLIKNIMTITDLDIMNTNTIKT